MEWIIHGYIFNMGDKVFPLPSLIAAWDKEIENNWIKNILNIISIST